MEERGKREGGKRKEDRENGRKEANKEGPEGVAFQSLLNSIKVNGFGIDDNA
jgi:hypothetical protein